MGFGSTGFFGAFNSGAFWLRLTPVVFVLIWSTGFIVAKYVLPYAPPLHFLAARYALSVLAFAVWAWFANARWPPSSQQWLHMALTGVLMHAGYQGGVWLAVRYGMGAALVALLVCLQPVLTAFWLSLVAARTPNAAQAPVNRRQWLGLVLGLAGLALVLARKLGISSEVTFFTLACALTGLLSITVGTLYQKRYLQPCDVPTANAVQMAAACLVTAPLAFFEAGEIVWSVQLFGAMTWAVLGLTLGGSSLLYLLIRRGAATEVTSLFYLVPPVTALMAWLLFGESITWLTVLGTALTAFGVALVVQKQKPR